MMLKLLRKIFSKLNYLFFVGSTDILPEPFSFPALSLVQPVLPCGY